MHGQPLDRSQTIPLRTTSAVCTKSFTLLLEDSATTMRYSSCISPAMRYNAIRGSLSRKNELVQRALSFCEKIRENGEAREVVFNEDRSYRGARSGRGLRVIETSGPTHQHASPHITDNYSFRSLRAPIVIGDPRVSDTLSGSPIFYPLLSVGPPFAVSSFSYRPPFSFHASYRWPRFVSDESLQGRAGSNQPGELETGSKERRRNGVRTAREKGKEEGNVGIYCRDVLPAISFFSPLVYG